MWCINTQVSAKLDFKEERKLYQGEIQSENSIPTNFSTGIATPSANQLNKDVHLILLMASIFLAFDQTSLQT